MTALPLDPGALDPHSAARTRGPRGRAGSGQTLYAELAAQVRGMGLLRRRPGWYLTRMVAGTLLLAGLLAAHVLLGDTWWQLLLAGGVAVVLTQLAFLGHDAAHRQVFTGGRANDWTALVLINLLLGMSHSWWTGKHSRHHGNPNREGRDPDLGSRAVAMTPAAMAARTRPGSWLARKQGWFVFPLMLLEGLALHAHGLRVVFGRRGFRRRWLEAAFLVLRLGGYVALVAVVLPPGKAAAFLGVQLGLFGLYMGLAFAPNHIGMPVLPREAELDFLRKQVLTSRNIAGGRAVDELMGGLNLQIEHHLFPSMPRPHLRLARPVVEAFCRRHDISYASPSLLTAYGEVRRYLDGVGQRRADPFSCPFVARYRLVAPPTG
ncbi:fatty acid desaturase family protein [Aquipuribacter sp. SD81]|uniref:fatty acid desaturase family protein n=1 Tax=Aquipuribacter sp. SD81 TaxID=3127703 RepID=UPI0030197C16